MADFDDLWNDDMGIDLDTIDRSVKVSDHVNKQTKNTNSDDMLSIDDPTKSFEQNDEEWDKLPVESKWRKLITTEEHNLKSQFTNAEKQLKASADSLNYALDHAKDDNQAHSLVLQLKELQNAYINLVNAARDMAADINFDKLRAVGVITADNYMDFLENPMAVEKILRTGNYEYEPTEFN